ncbi:hypothetical protein [Thiolapillus brandeum]|uniref:hypothetical protein n=1 Tax=Thiolapillus brandeum TaxID=1076588 RepID=UPI000696C780|nr:hypothetical protein [Thiolapillus brandeum]
MTFIFEQSATEIYASHGGLSMAGPIINRHSGLKKHLRLIPPRHGIAHIDLVRTYLGLLCQGKNVFESLWVSGKIRFCRTGIHRFRTIADLHRQIS